MPAEPRGPANCERCPRRALLEAIARSIEVQQRRVIVPMSETQARRVLFLELVITLALFLMGASLIALGTWREHLRTAEQTASHCDGATP